MIEPAPQDAPATERRVRLSVIIERALWIGFLLPGLAYRLWRLV